MLLIHIGEFHSLSDAYLSAVGFLKPHDKAEQSSLTSSIRADDTHNPSRRKHKRKMLEQQLVSVGLGHILEFDHFVAKLRPIGNIDLKAGLLLLAVLACKLLISSDPGLGFCLSGLGSHPYPFELSFEGLSALAFLFLLHLKPFGLLLKPRGIVALPRDSFASVELKNPSSNVIEEIAVMCYGDHSTFVLL